MVSSVIRDFIPCSMMKIIKTVTDGCSHAFNIWSDQNCIAFWDKLPNQRTDNI